MAVLLQWNCCGFRANKHELDLLISENSPSVICLQETFMPKDIALRHFVSYNIHADVDQQNHPHGGVSLLIKNNIPQSQVPLRTHLKAVAARVTLDPVSYTHLTLPTTERV